MTLNTMGLRLRYLRQKRGWSIKEAARYSGIPAENITEWERDRSLPTVDMLAKLSEVYGGDIDFLLQGPKESPRKLSLEACLLLNEAYRSLNADEQRKVVEALEKMIEEYKKEVTDQ